MSEKSTCLVYLVTNLNTEKWYVGKTQFEESIRWRRHLDVSRSGASYAISRSIRKHGPEAFHRQVIADGLTWDEASNLERIWIILLQSYKSKFGYNLTMGGDGVRHNEETRKKVSEALTGRTFTDESKANMREGQLRRRREGNGTEKDFVPRADIDNDDVVKMYLSGTSLPIIAEKYETDHACIARRLAKMNIPRRSHRESVPNRKDFPIETIVSLYQDGNSTATIAETFNTTHETIRKKLKTAGVVLRTRSEANLVRHQNQRKSTG